MQMIEVTVQGCDDSTSVELEVSPVELAIIAALAEKITAASGYPCMPVMQVRQL